MERLKTQITEEYKYESEEERLIHIEKMENQGYECDGQIRKKADGLMSKNSEYYWFARFYKYE